MNNTICPSCNFTIQNDWYYCPNCGKTLRNKPITVSVAKQLLIYSVSFFLAPLGLAWGIRYIRNSNRNTRIVGLISIILTLIAIAFTIYSFGSIMAKYTNMLNNLGSGRYIY